MCWRTQNNESKAVNSKTVFAKEVELFDPKVGGLKVTMLHAPFVLKHSRL
jgi:hypothetical protein